VTLEEMLEVKALLSLTTLSITDDPLLVILPPPSATIKDSLSLFVALLPWLWSSVRRFELMDVFNVADAARSAGTEVGGINVMTVDSEL
jgi:hypothetical protein